MNEEKELTAQTGGAGEAPANAGEASAKVEGEAATGGVCEIPTSENAKDSATGAEDALVEAEAATAAESATDNAGEPATEPEGEDAPLSEGEMAAILADPMFLPFARGKKGDIPTLCRDFREMLAAGGARTAPTMTASVTARMTPTSASSLPEVALNERQRSLARAAGMTYREYFELASDIPNTILHHK